MYMAFDGKFRLLKFSARLTLASLLHFRNSSSDLGKLGCYLKALIFRMYVMCLI